MDMESHLLFFFSAIGAFNGFLLSIYFACVAKTKRFSNYYLAFLLFVLSIRVIKSVFYHFLPDLSGVFIQFGLSACLLIGPFLYLYLKRFTTDKPVNWAIHVLPFSFSVTLLGFLFPYWSYKTMWSPWMLGVIYNIWLAYLIYSFKYVFPILKRSWQKKKVDSLEFWVLSIYFGVFIIWLAYYYGVYVSYLVGALSFSFVLYLAVLLLIFKSFKKTSFFKAQTKYKGKAISSDTIRALESSFAVLKEKELYLNPKFTIDELAKELNFSKHLLSQYFNERLKKSFSTYINELRIEKAKELLQSGKKYTIEGIGYESGFNSKSTFFTLFKKTTGQTPSQYQSSL